MKGAQLAMKTKTKTNSRQVLRFSPTAWAKLIYLRDVGDTEIGGFGISCLDDLFYLEDVELVSQRCTWSHVRFDDEAVADYFERQVRAGRQPAEFARIWVHTHPGNSAQPSSTDEATFTRVFSRADWAVMLILARDGQAYARLRFNAGPGAEMELAVEVDYQHSFDAADHVNWRSEYEHCVRRETSADSSFLRVSDEWPGLALWPEDWDDDNNLKHQEDQFDYVGDT